jgi:hypothetical protein
VTAALLLMALAAAKPVLREEPFRLERAAETVALLTAGCEGCAWGTKGREAAVLALSIDGRYSQHLILTRGERPAEYRVLLGALGAGPHRLTLAVDPAASAPGAGAVHVDRVELLSASPAEAMALSHAPVLHARPNTLGRFSDVPLLVWYEAERTARGTRLRYSAVFSNEDGGTPADRLMATWGRLTDIEYVYGVEVDDDGRVLAQEYQGRNHMLLAPRAPEPAAHRFPPSPLRLFPERPPQEHPLLWVVTDNNMLSDRGVTSQRYAPAPFPFELRNVSREAVMDANPWTYRVSAEEARREGRVADDARPGSGKLPDPRRFAYVEACAETRDATLAFAVGVEGAGGAMLWRESDGGHSNFRIARSATNFPNGCFRAAVALPRGADGSGVRALRFRAFTRPPAKGEAPLRPGSGSARLKRVNKLFLLGADDTPGPSLFSWTGDVALLPEGPPVELPLPIP